MTGDNELDLWYALHDAMLRLVTSDPFTRTATVVIENASLNEFCGFNVQARIELRFAEVHSLLVFVARRHTSGGGFEPIRRIESASWSAFERTFNLEDLSLNTQRYEITNARILRSEDALEFIIDEVVDYLGFTASEDDLLCELRIEARAIEVVFPDGRVRSIDDFNALAARFWTEWSRSGSLE